MKKINQIIHEINSKFDKIQSADHSSDKFIYIDEIFSDMLTILENGVDDVLELLEKYQDLTNKYTDSVEFINFLEGKLLLNSHELEEYNHKLKTYENRIYNIINELQRNWQDLKNIRNLKSEKEIDNLDNEYQFAYGYKVNRRYEDAEFVYKRIIEEYRYHYKSRNDLADIYKKQKKYKEGIDQVKEITKQRPNDFISRNVLAEIFREIDKYQEALNEINIGLRLDHKNNYFRFNALMIYIFFQPNAELAKKQIEEYKKLTNQDLIHNQSYKDVIYSFIINLDTIVSLKLPKSDNLFQDYLQEARRLNSPLYDLLSKGNKYDYKYANNIISKGQLLYIYNNYDVPKQIEEFLALQSEKYTIEKVELKNLNHRILDDFQSTIIVLQNEDLKLLQNVLNEYFNR